VTRSVVAVIFGLAAAASGSAAAQGKAGCDSQAAYDTLDIKCPLSASGAVQRFRFRVYFSGSHDDTTASLTTTLDGAPLACEKGSKTSLAGEDGEVSLECRFSNTGKSGTKQLLGVTISWRHAQYKDFEFERD